VRRNRTRGFVHRLAVLAVLAGLLVPFVMSGHPVLETDRDCGPIVLGAHATTEFETDVPPNALDHCAFCHFLRTISGAAPSTPGAFTPALPEVTVALATNDRLHNAGHLGLQPTRAPPSFS
jgi:hypothetical protein